MAEQVANDIRLEGIGMATKTERLAKKHLWCFGKAGRDTESCICTAACGACRIYLHRIREANQLTDAEFKSVMDYAKAEGTPVSRETMRQISLRMRNRMDTGYRSRPQVTARLDVETLALLDKICRDEGLSRTRLIEYLIQRFVWGNDE